jgi:D-glycero-alpha-D-manno-heptose 1-phosphate guanylyltransferase
MQAIILAGGFGTRLKDKISDLPKPMAPIKGVPFLSIIFNQLISHGFTKVVLAVGYKSDKIVSYYNNRYRNLAIEYSFEDEPLGTGGCVKKAMSHIDDDYVFIINGDTYFDVNFKDIQKPNRVLIVCKYMENSSRYGKIMVNNNVITSFAEKNSSNSGLINGGIYYFKTTLFSEFMTPSSFSLEKDFFEKYVNELKIDAYESDGYFIDIGIPDDFERAERELNE